MAKRAPILPDNYNPVGERLQRLLQPVVPAPEPVAEALRVIELSRVEPPAVPLKVAATLPEREPIPEVPVDHELKTVSVRFRCTPGERKKWHEITRELSSDHNNLSHFIRAAMLLVENSYEPLRKLAPDIQRFQKPATTDPLGITLYEQRLAQYLYDAIKLAGRPRG